MDAAPLAVLADARDPRLDMLGKILASERGLLVIPAPVTAEADYLLRTRLGRRPAHALLEDIAHGRFVVEGLTQAEHSTALDIHDRYADLDLGLADLSVIMLAYRHGTHRLLTFDDHHFRAVTPLDGGAFVLLPADFS